MLELNPNNFKDGKKLAIWMHENPDPDAIGAALGLAWIVKAKWGILSDVFYNGAISHPENKSLMNVLNLAFKTKEDFFTNHEEHYPTVAVVDGSPSRTGLSENEQGLITIMIDHHRAKVTEENFDYLLNKQVGSSATLIYQMIEELNLEMKAEDEVQATALLMGIITDTNNLLSENSTEEDNEAFAYFKKYANLSQVKEIQSYPIPSYFYDYQAIASDPDNKSEVNGALITFLGLVNDQKQDVLAYLSEAFLRKEGIDTTVVAAIVGTNIQASIRSSKVSLDVNEFAKKVFGADYAGGKRGAGAAKVPMGFFAPRDDFGEFKEDVNEITKNWVMSMIKKEITKDS
jgi:nanoRNase/pAp phosphatase (c-di-AMP/oligoRNAs hydrolase)